MDDYPYSLPHYEFQPSLYEADPGSGEPRKPIVFWIIWLLLGIPLMIVDLEMLFAFHFLAQLMLTTTWLGLSTRMSARFFVPTAICHTPIVIMLVFRSPMGAVIAVLVSLAMFGLPWVIFRAFRLITLDFLQTNPDGVLVAPMLAERVQFSLRTIGAVCVLSALCCALWVGADHWRDFREFKYLVAIFVPCELLFLLGMLGRAAWPWRAVLLTAATLLMLGSFWLIRLSSTDDLWLGLLIPADQFVVLAVLRRAGYRIGMPRSVEIEQVAFETKQSSSPWDD